MADAYTAPPVALGIKTPDMGATSPLDTVAKFAGIQNQLNQNQLFQQTFAARKKMGEIIATSPDPETAIKRMYADPVAAPFAGETVTQMRQGALALQQLQGEQQSQAISGAGVVTKAMVGALADPSNFDKIVNSQMSTLSPYARKASQEYVSGIRSAIFDGLPKDPTQAHQVMQQRIIGSLLSAGVTPDQIHELIGRTATRDTGGAIQSGVELPAGLGGGFQGANQVQKTIPPGFQTINGIPVPTINGQIQSQPGQDSSQPVGLGGLGIMSPLEYEAASTLNKEFETKGAQEYNNAQNVKQSLHFISQGLTNLSRGGGFMTPGTAGAERAAFAKLGNTLASMMGQQPPFDPEKVASAEELMKETYRLGSAYASQIAGGHTAFEAVSNGIKSVPGIENTPLGGQILVAGIGSTADRAIDLRHYQTQWLQDPKHKGSLIGSVEAFNKDHPAEDYARRALAQFGMDEHGFKTKEDLGKALRGGFITRKQAEDIAAHEGWK